MEGKYQKQLEAGFVFGFLGQVEFKGLIVYRQLLGPSWSPCRCTRNLLLGPQVCAWNFAKPRKTGSLRSKSPSCASNSEKLQFPANPLMPPY